MKTTEDVTLPLKKIRSDSTWNALSHSQREKLEVWLFGEGLSYREVLARAPDELGATISKSSLGRIHQHIAKRRAHLQIDASIHAATAMQSVGMSLEDFRRSALTLIGSRFMETAMERGDVNELIALDKLLSGAEARQMQRERQALAQMPRRPGTSGPNQHGAQPN